MKLTLQLDERLLTDMLALFKSTEDVCTEMGWDPRVWIAYRKQLQIAMLNAVNDEISILAASERMPALLAKVPTAIQYGGTQT